MKNAITVIDRELIDWFGCHFEKSGMSTSEFDMKTEDLLQMTKDLIEINAELTKRSKSLENAIKEIPSSVNTSCYLKGLDKPTEFAISQAKSMAIGSVMDKVRSAKKLLKGDSDE
ncbi:hypothetical protein [Pseudoalteromonas sp.]|uniref:hypothetical protein n=1 Tax=Pseudoalteromonas sp. TaxID=53249 RepID=UPI003D1359B6